MTGFMTMHNRINLFSGIATAICSFMLALCVHAYSNEFITVCYHDIPASETQDRYAVPLKDFIEQIEYMKSHGYNFVSPADIMAASRNKSTLPEKSVLLSFDDAYVTFYSNVVPVLELYQCPAVLAICSSWIEHQPPDEIPAPLMNWEQIAGLAKHPLVTIASHSFDLHKAVQFNPQGNTAHAATSRIYNPASKTYETETAYRKRIAADMIAGRDIIQQKTGVTPEIFVWPYGEYNSITMDEAASAGFQMAFSLSRQLRTSTANLMELDRWLILDNPVMTDFIYDLNVRTLSPAPELAQTRAIQADLDLIYDPDPVQTERNLDKFLERIVAIKPNTVYLQGFADPDGDGNVDSVYFPNRVLPMRMDLLSRVANQLYIRGFQVYIWMPVLAITLPDSSAQEKLRVMERRQGKIAPSSSWYDRLSPFSEETLKYVSALYEDLAIHTRFHGILFQDDAYLNDFEDFNPAAVEIYKKEFQTTTFNPYTLTNEQHAKWTRLKTQQLNRFTQHLMESVRKYRPQTRFARNMYVPALTQPHSEEWLCQNYADYLAIYDKTVIMAYPEHEGIRRENTWLEKLVELSSAHPEGLEKTVFKIQAYNWEKNRRIDSERMITQTRRLVARGARHIAYYPDDYTINTPEQHIIRREISTSVHLFVKPAMPAKESKY